MSEKNDEFEFIPMNEVYADEIAYEWKYENEYSFYNMQEDEEDLEEFLNSEYWGNIYFAVLSKGKLIGFFLYNFENEVMWIGFGLKPSLTGKGLGNDFIITGMKYGINKFNYDKKFIMLSVAEFNKRAIRLYKKIGFIKTEKYNQKTNGGIFPFIKMKKEITLIK